MELSGGVTVQSSFAYWFEWFPFPPPKIRVHLEPQNVNFFGNGIFADVMS